MHSEEKLPRTQNPTESRLLKLSGSQRFNTTQHRVSADGLETEDEEVSLTSLTKRWMHTSHRWTGSRTVNRSAHLARLAWQTWPWRAYHGQLGCNDSQLVTNARRGYCMLRLNRPSAMYSYRAAEGGRETLTWWRSGSQTWENCLFAQSPSVRTSHCNRWGHSGFKLHDCAYEMTCRSMCDLRTTVWLKL